MLAGPNSLFLSVRWTQYSAGSTGLPSRQVHTEGFKWGKHVNLPPEATDMECWHLLSQHSVSVCSPSHPDPRKRSSMNGD